MQNSALFNLIFPQQPSIEEITGVVVKTYAQQLLATIKVTAVKHQQQETSVSTLQQLMIDLKDVVTNITTFLVDSNILGESAKGGVYSLYHAHMALAINAHRKDFVETAVHILSQWIVIADTLEAAGDAILKAVSEVEHAKEKMGEEKRVADAITEERAGYQQEYRPRVLLEFEGDTYELTEFPALLGPKLNADVYLWDATTTYTIVRDGADYILTGGSFDNRVVLPNTTYSYKTSNDKRTSSFVVLETI